MNLICVFDIVKDTREVRGVRENESEEAVLHNDICEHAEDLCLQIMLRKDKDNGRSYLAMAVSVRNPLRPMRNTNDPISFPSKGRKAPFIFSSGRIKFKPKLLPKFKELNAT